ncbi:MAG: dTMP kinase [Ktedonobacteraceae bacterium]
MSAETNTQAHRSSFLLAHTYPGRLITAEGLDGSGKSTQLRLLQFWLQAEGHEVVLTELTASKLIKRALKAGKKEGSMDPMLLSILHAADFAELYERDIVPALARGAVVLADRYVYTALARDLARGVEQSWIEDVYRFAVRPDLSIYFQISAEQSLERTLSHQARVKYYQAGMDLGLSGNPIDSFRAFQQRILHAYERMLDTSDLLRLDATLPVKLQQRFLREAVENVLPDE